MTNDDGWIEKNDHTLLFRVPTRTGVSEDEGFASAILELEGEGKVMGGGLEKISPDDHSVDGQMKEQMIFFFFCSQKAEISESIHQFVNLFIYSFIFMMTPSEKREEGGLEPVVRDQKHDCS